jgi:hypothetical protein
MDPTALERDIDARLNALPAPVAPASLLARVMREVPDEPRGWVRPWFAWDPRMQVAAALVAVAGTAALVWSSATWCAWLQPMLSAEPFTVARVLWHSLQPLIAGGSIYLVVMGVVVACLAAALTHVTSEGTGQS